MSSKHLQYHREALQRKSQQDWANREYVQLMTSSITRIADFLNTFHRSCSGRLASLDERLTSLERKVVFLETKVGQGQEIQNLGEFWLELSLVRSKNGKSADFKNVNKDFDSSIFHFFSENVDEIEVSTHEFSSTNLAYIPENILFTFWQFSVKF